MTAGNFGGFEQEQRKIPSFSGNDGSENCENQRLHEQCNAPFLCRRLLLPDLLKRDFGNAHPTSSLRIAGELQIDNTIPQIRNGTVLFRNHHIYGTLLPFLRQFERSHDIIMFPDMRTKLSPYLQLGTDCVLLFIRFCPETAASRSAVRWPPPAGAQRISPDFWYRQKNPNSSPYASDTSRLARHFSRKAA